MMALGFLVGLGRGYSVIAPDVVIRPILLPPYSVNHNAPSDPGAMPSGKPKAVGKVYSVTLVAAVGMRPILSPLYSVNHSAPSGPVVIPEGSASIVGMAYSPIPTCCAGKTAGRLHVSAAKAATL